MSPQLLVSPGSRDVCHSTSHCACPRMNITWHSLAQRVLGVMKCGISHKTSLPRPGLTFRDVVQTGEERHQKYNTLNTDKLASRLRKEEATDTMRRRGVCLHSPTLYTSVSVKLRATAHFWLDRMAVNNRNKDFATFQATSALKFDRNAPSSSRSSVTESNFATSSAHSHCCVPGVSVVLRQVPKLSGRSEQGFRSNRDCNLVIHLRASLKATAGRQWHERARPGPVT